MMIEICAVAAKMSAWKDVLASKDTRQNNNKASKYYFYVKETAKRSSIERED